MHLDDRKDAAEMRGRRHVTEERFDGAFMAFEFTFGDFFGSHAAHAPFSGAYCNKPRPISISGYRRLMSDF